MNTETFELALNWTQARRDAEVSAIIDFLTVNFGVLRDEQVVDLLAEKRAISMATGSALRLR